VNDKAVLAGLAIAYDNAMAQNERDFAEAEAMFDRAAAADDRARQEAKVGAAVAAKVLGLFPHRTDGYVTVRPRRSRGRTPRTRRVRVRSGSRGDPPSEPDDDPDPAGRALARLPVVLLGAADMAGPSGRNVSGQVMPACPRCGTAINVRVVPGDRLPTCRWCAWENWRRSIEHDVSRLLDEADRITKDAA
jgi:hypothetical protein